MQQIYTESFLRGYARKTMRSIQDITQHPYKHVIEQRLKIIQFYDDFGEQATRQAFSVSRSTVFSWKRRLKDNNGSLRCLAPKSTAPKHKRKRMVDMRITNFILEQRSLHPKLSKDKLAILLKDECTAWNLKPPSASTVGRILKDLKFQGLLPKYTRLTVSGATGKLLEKQSRKPRLNKQRRNGYQPEQPGDMLQIDTIVKFINGIRRYVLTAVDYKGRFGFAYGYTSPSSTNAADFLNKLQAVTPFEIRRVHHDNGSEFYKHFIRACDERNIEQLWNYPKRPKNNGMVERFNRSIQEEFIDWNLDNLAYDLEDFNNSLMDWCIWYNTKRPHYGLGLKSPMQYLLEVLQLSQQESRMLWTDTLSCFTDESMVLS